MRSAEPITGPPWVLRAFRDHAGIPLFRSSRLFSRVRSSVLKVSRLSHITLVERGCQCRWIRPEFVYQNVDTGPNVCSHLPLGPCRKPVGLGLKQSSFRHTRLALITQRIDDFLLRDLLHMLWSPSPFGVRVSGVCRKPSISSHNISCPHPLPLKRRTRICNRVRGLPRHSPLALVPQRAWSTSTNEQEPSTCSPPLIRGRVRSTLKQLYGSDKKSSSACSLSWRERSHLPFVASSLFSILRVSITASRFRPGSSLILASSASLSLSTVPG